MVVSKVVVWIGDPEGGWRLISIEQRPRPLRLHDQVPVYLVVSFDSVLDEDVVSFHVVDHIVSQSQVGRAVESEGSVESFVD